MSILAAIKGYWKPVMGTIGAFLSGVYLAAIFHGQPYVKVAGGPTLVPYSSTTYRVSESFMTTQGTLEVFIASGFIFDGASIPRAAWSPLGLSPWSPTVIRGALVHDALYASRLVLREEADSILYAAVLQDGTEPHKGKAVYRAVADCGSLAWNRTSTTRTREARKYVSIRRL